MADAQSGMTKCCDDPSHEHEHDPRTAEHVKHATEVRSDWLKKELERAENEDRKSGVWDMKSSPVTATEDDFHNLLGNHVRLKGLAARPELNGCIGRCYSWDAEVGRAGIRILSDGFSRKMLAIKPVNLDVLADDVAATLLAAAQIPTLSPIAPTIHKDFEFNENEDFDRYALYLRPLDANGAPLEVAGASASQERWGGLHATLCSFAPSKDSGASVAHTGALGKALDRAFNAVKVAAGQAATSWFLKAIDSLEASHGGRALDLPQNPCLEAMCAAVAAAGVCNPRPAHKLHISIGDAEAADAARAALIACKRWEVCVAKCARGVNPLRVSEIVERRELAWEEAEPSVVQAEVMSDLERRWEFLRKKEKEEAEEGAAELS